MRSGVANVSFPDSGPGSDYTVSSGTSRDQDAENSTKDKCSLFSLYATCSRGYCRHMACDWGGLLGVGFEREDGIAKEEQVETLRSAVVT